MMEPVEVTLADGAAIFSFDGRVFEYFGGYGLGGGHKVSAYRIHKDQLSVKVESPDRKGRSKVKFGAPAGYGIEWECADENELQAFTALLDALRGAAVTFET